MILACRRRSAAAALAVAAFTLLPASAAPAAPAGYPTETLADYVFGCMAANGQTQDALRRCSCSIDQIAGRLTYDEYVQAETVLRTQRMPGGDNRAVLFRSTPATQGMVDRLRQAQVEAEARCF